MGTFRSLDLEVTVPGGGAVGAEGVTNVAVIPDSRRRGLLGRMMRVGLDNAVARGHSMAALIASEYRIYGRFGFGPATRAARYDIDVLRAGGIRGPGTDGSVELSDLDEVRRYGARSTHLRCAWPSRARHHRPSGVRLGSVRARGRTRRHQLCYPCQRARRRRNEHLRAGNALPRRPDNAAPRRRRAGSRAADWCRPPRRPDAPDSGSALVPGRLLRGTRIQVADDPLIRRGCFRPGDPPAAQ